MEVVAGMSGTPIGNQIVTAEAICDGIIANPTVATVLPAPLTIKTKLGVIKGWGEEKKQASNLLKSINEKINAGVREVRIVINGPWCSQVEATPGITAAGVKLINMRVKGEVTDGVDTKVVGRASNSNPMIAKIETDVHMKHTIHIINSVSGKVGVPDDAESLIIYMQVGGVEPPTDINKMTYLGKVKRGKYVNGFTQDDVGKTVYYICVYTEHKTEKAMTYSPVAIAVVN